LFITNWMVLDFKKYLPSCLFHFKIQIKPVSFGIELQWKPLNVITDNVIIRIMLSEWPGPKSLSINYYIKNSDIVIALRILLSVCSQKLQFLCQKHINLIIFHCQAIISAFYLMAVLSKSLILSSNVFVCYTYTSQKI
jgi:hypothetical protein